jgi:hypothetical protein
MPASRVVSRESEEADAGTSLTRLPQQESRASIKVHRARIGYDYKTRSGGRDSVSVCGEDLFSRREAAAPALPLREHLFRCSVVPSATCKFLVRTSIFFGP